MDGDIDYSKYDLRELLEIQKYINQAEFPKNYANLVDAIAAHPNSINVNEHPDPEGSGVWASMDGERRFQTLGAKDTAIYLAIFFVVFYPVMFSFEFMFITLGWSVGTIVRVVYFAISAAVVGAVFGAKEKRLMTANEFSGFGAATVGTHLLLMLVLTLLYAAGTEAEFGFACGPACGLFSLALIVLLELGLLFLCLRFVMRWAMIATAGSAK